MSQFTDVNMFLTFNLAATQHTYTPEPLQGHPHVAQILEVHHKGRPHSGAACQQYVIRSHVLLAGSPKCAQISQGYHMLEIGSRCCSMALHIMRATSVGTCRQVAWHPE